MNDVSARFDAIPRVEMHPVYGDGGKLVRCVRCEFFFTDPLPDVDPVDAPVCPDCRE